MSGYTGHVQVQGVTGDGEERREFTARLVVYGGIIVDAGEPLAFSVRMRMGAFKRHVDQHGWRAAPVPCDRSILQTEIILAWLTFEALSKASTISKRAGFLASRPLNGYEKPGPFRDAAPGKASGGPFNGGIPF